MLPKLIQFQLFLITTLVGVQLFKTIHPFWVLAVLIIGFVFTLRSHKAFSAILLLSLFSIPQNPSIESDFSDFELVGRIVEGPIFQSGGCRYHIRSQQKQIWKISTPRCDAFPNDRVEAFIRPSKNHRFSGRAIDFYTESKPTFSLLQTITRSRTVWINKTKSLQHQGLTVALTTGNKAFLEPRTIDLFRDLGLSHLLAISGLHFGIVATFLWFILGGILGRFPNLILRYGKKKIVGPLVILGLYVFLLFVGAPISATRAFVMVTAYILGTILSRYIRPSIAVLYALCALLIYDPSNIGNLGFQLSFCAVIGILCVLKNGKLLNDLGGESVFKRQVFSLLFVSVGAGISTLPVLLHHTGQISWIAFPLNFLIVPIFSVLIFPTLLICALLFRFGGPAASIGEFLLNMITNIMLKLVDVFSFLPFLPGARTFPGQIPEGVAIALFLAIAYCLYNLERLRPRVIFAIAITAVGLVFVSAPTLSPDKLHVHFIDVGQGDSIFIRTPEGKNVLIDTGGTMFGSDPGQWIVAPYLKGLGISKLDAILITHNDQDHNGGLAAVQRTIQSDRIIKTLAESAYLREIGFQVFQYEGGSKNNRSIVLKYQYGKSCIALSGDIEKEAEMELADELSNCSVLKLAHHGSKTSSSSYFLDRVRPAFVVISAGRNNHFGHPHFSVLERLRTRGIEIFNTQKQGSIALEIDSVGVVKATWAMLAESL